MKDIKLLGLRVRDKVTGFEGVVSSISYDLYGCIQAVVSPPAKDGVIPDGRWFDTSRLIPLTDTPVMTVPSFAVSAPEKGPQEKSVPRGL